MRSMITKAFLFALYAHGEQKRKDGLPYIMHPVEVAMELARNGASEELICAGFLHDTIEDAFVTREQLVAAFTETIADLVAADSENKEDVWEKRKRDALAVLRRPGDRDHKLLMCADKLSNLRSMHEGLETDGEDVFCATSVGGSSRHGCFGRRWTRLLRWRDCRCMKSSGN